MLVRNHERAMPRTLPTDEIQSAVRLVRDYPACVWLFKADHLSEIANWCMDQGKEYDDVAYRCSREFHDRLEGRNAPVAGSRSMFRPADPDQGICASDPAGSSEGARTGSNPDPIAPRHRRVSDAGTGSLGVQCH